MRSLAIFILTLLPMLLIGQTSIYDIQHTTVAGDGTYPSLYDGQTVTTGGIVTVTGYNGGRYFISSPEGGPWNGLFVYDNNYSPNVGDCSTPQADTVSIVQRPLLNIPSIAEAGETLTIECFAPENTTDWNATLVFDEYTKDIPVESADYDSYLEK